MATKDLPANHLLQPGDLTLHTTGRQYVLQKVPAGRVIDADDIWTAPHQPGDKGTVPVSVAVARTEVDAGVAAAGKTLQLCPIKSPARVLAVYCGARGGGCVALTEVADADAAKLAASDAPEITLKAACE